MLIIEAYILLNNKTILILLQLIVDHLNIGYINNYYS